MTAPQSVLQLVETFTRNAPAYKSTAYNEAQIRNEFINPLFAALGWDVYNANGYAEAYKDVIHEDAIKIGSATKAPDYCFRIGGTRKFFVEAKKPAINLKDDIPPAFQLRRYAWSAKLPLSVLTDFEEFAVYDTRVRPVQTDKSTTARTMYIKYPEYPEKWDQIADIFSRDAVLKGSFDKYAQSSKRKKGTAEVDTAFLAEIETWRDSLAHHLALRNPGLATRQLNFAVQRTIDRIIFLRICEDRAIEQYGQLQALISGPATYQRLLTLYDRADERYNSGLFYFHSEKDRPDAPDQLSHSLIVDDKPLKDIIRRLYYPDSPYEFSVLPADILGQVYEQFLGKVITLTPKHRAKVEDKPEVKKAGGVYYTPTYIVDYIVKHTVAELLKKRSVKFYKTRPPQLDKPLRVLDPACGSGSFLIVAYQTLLDWHLDYYTKNDPNQWLAAKNPPIYQAAGDIYRLTTAERKRILLAHIFGVDIDSAAVEVTKLSLLLKVLEGENADSVSNQLRLFHERVLPDLSNNIKCGNSLIAPDFYQNQQLNLFSEDDIYRINAFDWNTEFPEVFNAPSPGFDAVIGNPPYIRMESFKELKTYLAHRYVSHEERADMYVYFIEQAHRLLQPFGLFGMIVSNKFLRAKYGAPLRKFLSDNVHIQEVVDFAGLPVFQGATVRTIILLTDNDLSSDGPAQYTPPSTIPFIQDPFC